MKKRLTTLLLVLIMFITSNLFSVEAVASDVPLAAGEKFVVDDITYYVKTNTEVEAVSAALKLSVINIPGSVTYNGVTYEVTSIPGGAFYGNRLATKIIVSEGVRRIGSTAFQGADAVVEIVLPSTLETFTTIGFKSLSTITLATNNPYFQLKDGVLFSKDGSKLWLYPSAKPGSSYTVPSGVTTIVEAAFYENQNLQTLIFSNTVKTLEDYAICHMNALASITLDGISTIGSHNLRYCGNLKSLTIRNTGRIGNYCVYDCGALETISISGSTSGYGTYAFYKLPNLKRYDVSNSTHFSSKDGVLYGGTKLLRYPASKAGSTYVVPDGTSGIAGLAFGFMKNTNTVILNPGVNLDLLAFHYPNENSPMTIYFRDKNNVTMSKSSSGVFVGMNSGSQICLPTDTSLQSFLSYGSAVNPSGSAYVIKQGVGATTLVISENKAELKKGETLTLTGSMSPVYTTDDIHWSSDDTSIATVSADGVVTAVKKGKCTITATTDSGVKKTCSITVIKTEVYEKEEDSNKETPKNDKKDNASNKDDSNINRKEDSKNKDVSKTNPVKKEEKKDGLLDKCIDLFTGGDENNSKDTEDIHDSEGSNALGGTNTNSKETEDVSISDEGSDIDVWVVCVVFVIGGIVFLVVHCLKKRGNTH